MRELIEDLGPELADAGARRQVRGTAERTRHQRHEAIARLQADETQTDITRSHYYGSDQAKPVARAASLRRA